MSFWQYTGSAPKAYPNRGITANPGDVFDFGTQGPPLEAPLSGPDVPGPSFPASLWVASAGPATAARGTDSLPAGLDSGYVCAAYNATGVAIAPTASGTVGSKIDVPYTGITVQPQGNRHVVVEFGATLKQTVAGQGSVYLTLVEVGPTTATRTLLFSKIVTLPNSTDPALQLLTIDGSYDLGTVTSARTFELQVLLYAPAANSPTAQICYQSTQPAYIRVRGRGDGYHVSAKQGRVQAGESDQVWRPTNPWTGCPVILLHGAGENGQYTHATTQMHSVNIASALAANGIPCISGDFGGANTFSNDTNMSRITAAVSYIRSQFPNCRQDKVILLGVSMGGGAAARWSQQNPSQTAGVIGLIPAFDTNDIYQNNRASLQATVGTAWGVTFPTALPAGALFAATSPNPAAAIPHLIGYSTVDTTVIPSTVTAYANGLSNKTLVVTDTSAGHSDTAVGGMPLNTIVDFVKTNGK